MYYKYLLYCSGAPNKRLLVCWLSENFPIYPFLLQRNDNTLLISIQIPVIIFLLVWERLVFVNSILISSILSLNSFLSEACIVMQWYC